MLVLKNVKNTVEKEQEKDSSSQNVKNHFFLFNISKGSYKCYGPFIFILILIFIIKVAKKIFYEFYSRVTQ